MNRSVFVILAVTSQLIAYENTGFSDEPASLESHPVNTWIKRTPLDGGPVSPRLGYEGACVWDSRHRLLVRYGGHNQGGGGERARRSGPSIL